MMFRRLATAALLASSLTLAQDKPYPIPDYDNAPFHYDTAKNALVELDTVQYVVGARPKGFAGAEAALILSGLTSTVKFASEAAVFVVKLKVGVDPRTLMDLNKATVNEDSGKREFVIYKKGMFTAEGTNPVVDISFKKVADGVYLVTPKTPLSSGEYFFSLLENAKSKVVYCFTIKTNP
jgi:hypothetical protein